MSSNVTSRRWVSSSIDVSIDVIHIHSSFRQVISFYLFVATVNISFPANYNYISRCALLLIRGMTVIFIEERELICISNKLCVCILWILLRPLFAQINLHIDFIVNNANVTIIDKRSKIRRKHKFNFIFQSSFSFRLKSYTYPTCTRGIHKSHKLFRSISSITPIAGLLGPRINPLVYLSAFGGLGERGMRINRRLHGNCGIGMQRPTMRCAASGVAALENQERGMHTRGRRRLTRCPRIRRRPRVQTRAIGEAFDYGGYGVSCRSYVS